MNKCPLCGEWIDLDNDWRYCPYCGIRFNKTRDAEDWMDGYYIMDT